MPGRALDPQALVDALPDGVVVADADARVTLISAVAARMLGIPASSVGRPLGEVLTLCDQDGNDWSDHNRPYAGLATRTAVPEQAWLAPDGTEVLVAARIHRPALDQPVAQVALTLRSGRGRERLDRERSDLVATVAHELRSPLTGVKAFVVTLLSRWDKLNDEQKKLMLTTVAADSDRLSRLIAELLDVARIDTGRLQLHTRPCDAHELVDRVVTSVAASTTRPITLRCADPTALPRVQADPDKLTQVMTNLVQNAVRHGDGAVTVTVGPHDGTPHDGTPHDGTPHDGTPHDGTPHDGTPHDGTAPDVAAHDPVTQGVDVVVDDEGEGIAPDLRRRVFTKFWKGGARGGTGLGLYIVGGLTRAHGGTVTIGDAPGGGARITVSWPATDWD